MKALAGITFFMDIKEHISCLIRQSILEYFVREILSDMCSCVGVLRAIRPVKWWIYLRRHLESECLNTREMHGGDIN